MNLIEESVACIRNKVFCSHDGSSPCLPVMELCKEDANDVNVSDRISEAVCFLWRGAFTPGVAMPLMERN